MDKQLFLDVNRFAARTAWAHPVMAFLAHPYALAILGGLFILALAGARLGAFGGSDVDQIAAVVWVALGSAVAYALALPVVHLVARSRPFVAVPQAVVLVPRPSGFSFPNEHAVIAGAFAMALWLSRSRWLAALSTLAALLLAFAPVYAGVAYPGDALGGLLIGVVVSLALYPLAIRSLRDLTHGVARSPFRLLVEGGYRKTGIDAGPAAHPKSVGESGAVRLLSPDEVSAWRQQEPGKARPIRIVPPPNSDGVSIVAPDEKATGGLRVLPPDQTGANPDASGTQG